MASGITPLEVMLEAMNKFRDEGQMLSACSVAKDAAPYLHPRLQTIEHGGPDGGPIQVSVARFTAEPLNAAGDDPRPIAGPSIGEGR